jgi:DNA-binding IclR family transcriptional regulator
MTRSALLSDLEAARVRGYSLDDREVLDFVMCVGAPVFDHRGRVIAGISAAGLYSEDRDTDAEGRFLMQTAMSISRLMGYHGNDGIGTGG